MPPLLTRRPIVTSSVTLMIDTRFMTLTRAKGRQPGPRPKAVASPQIERDGELERVIFKAWRRPMTLAALHRALDPVIGAWLTATCAWDDVAIGDHRFACFSTDVTRETQVYVQFWSEPLEPVLGRCPLANGSPCR